MLLSSLLSFFFNDTPTTEIYTLSLHDALPICIRCGLPRPRPRRRRPSGRGRVHLRRRDGPDLLAGGDRKSTRLNSSHTVISYAVFCLKKKKKKKNNQKHYKITTQKS